MNRTSNHSSYWQGRSVLVTGATGLLGGWMVPALVRRGADVTVLIRDGSPGCMLFRDGWLRSVSAVQGSLSDLDLLRRVIAEYGVTNVFHLAAQTLVGVAKVDPTGTLEANVRGTWNVLEAARECGSPQVIVASSDKAYGESTQLPYLESHPMQGRYPYDVSKSCADLISRMYAATYGLPVGVVRCGNLFGGGDLNFSRTIPGLVRSTLQGERFVIRSDGKYVRDFLYVEDAVEAYLCLAEHMTANPSLSGEAFNFSLGVRLTVLDIVNMVLRAMRRSDLEPIVQNTASAEIREQYMVATRAQDILGWRPTYGMEEGLRRTIAWYTDFLTNADGSEADLDTDEEPIGAAVDAAVSNGASARAVSVRTRQ